MRRFKRSHQLSLSLSLSFAHFFTSIVCYLTVCTSYLHQGATICQSHKTTTRSYCGSRPARYRRRFLYPICFPSVVVFWLCVIVAPWSYPLVWIIANTKDARCHIHSNFSTFLSFILFHTYFVRFNKEKQNSRRQADKQTIIQMHQIEIKWNLFNLNSFCWNEEVKFQDSDLIDLPLHYKSRTHISS